MFRLMRAMIRYWGGWADSWADAWATNKHVMAATYDAAIAKSGDRFNTVRNAVAQLMTIEQTRLEEIKTLHDRADKHERIKVGAQAAMQKRIDALKNSGQTKEQIQTDGEFIKHSGNYKDAVSTLAEINKQIADKEADLKDRKMQIADYKLELQQMQKNHEKLASEKTEAIADVAIAQQADQINNVLSGIAADTTDKDLEKVREQRKAAKQRGKINAELKHNDASLAENEYLQLAESSAADKTLDSLLDWGDDDKKDTQLADAKLPEN